jgi:hypothetical protein
MKMTKEQIKRVKERSKIILENIPGLSTLEAIQFITNEFEGIIQEHEPGELIVKGHCPICGASLYVEYGDDEGEIGIIAHNNQGELK